jgi:deazaflavin-dependent oxidoreductase (nitroreductase family)
MQKEPLAANLHPVALAIRRPQERLVRLMRRYFERAPGWVLLTTTGRKTGLPREVLLPCERTSEGLVVISTYGWRANWIRNIQRSSQVSVSVGGWVAGAEAEIIDDVDRKRSIVMANPFFPVAPFAIFQIPLRTVLRPVLQLLLKHWVKPRPIVFIRPERILSPKPIAPMS